MPRPTLLLVLLVALLAPAPGAAAAAPAHHGRTCDPTRGVRLDVRAAAAVPGDAGAPVGLAAARRLAAQLTHSASVCRGTVAASTRRSLRGAVQRARHGQRAAARQRLRALIRRLAHQRVARRAPAHTRAAAGGCTVGQPPTVKPDGRTQQLLAVQASAELVGDDATAQAASDAARQSYRDWAGGYQSAGIGDDLAIANGAMMMGLDDVADRALDRARTRAAADAAREMDSINSPCEAEPDAMRCALKAMVIAELLGVDGVFDSARATRMSQAIAARASGGLGPGCERWTFQMRFTQPADGQGLLEDLVWAWEPARFDLDRAQSQLFPLAPPEPAGWPLAINSPAGRCLETTPDGTIDHGPVTMTGGAFHYQLAGSATADTVSLTLTSGDAHLATAFQGDGNTMCNALLAMGQMVTDQFVSNPFPLPDLPLPAGQPTADLSDSGLEIHLRREI